MASSVLALTLATAQVDMSWAETIKPIGQIAPTCGPVFAQAADANKDLYRARLTDSHRKESVLKEYVWVQRRALTYKAASEVVSGMIYGTYTPEIQKQVSDDCFRDFAQGVHAASWQPVMAKVNVNAVDQTLEDLIESRVSFGYQRILHGSKALREQMPFDMGNSITAQRLVFDPPNLVLYAQAPDGFDLMGKALNAKPLFCSALDSHEFDRALYPLIRLKILEGDDKTLATASGSQCN